MFPEDEGENRSRQLCQEYNEDQQEELQREGLRIEDNDINFTKSFWNTRNADDGTHKKQQTLVFTYGPAAAQETQQEKHAPHSQYDVDPCEEKGVCCHYLPETCGVHHYPDPHTQQEGAAQLKSRPEMERETKQNKTLYTHFDFAPYWNKVYRHKKCI